MAITPKQAAESNLKQTVDDLEKGIDQQLDNEYTGNNKVKISLEGQSEKVISKIIALYVAETWIVEKDGSTLLFSAILEEQ